MKLLRLCTSHIQLNKPLPWNVRNEPGHLLLSKGFLLTQQAQIDTLLDRGVFVDQEEFEAHLREAKANQVKKDPFASWALILKHTGQLLRNYKDMPNFSEELSTLSTQINSTMHEDVNAGTFEMINVEPTGYSVSHSLQTAFVASMAAERFGWSDTDRVTLIRASLTMNIAMLDMQNALAQQTTPLTPQQRADIHDHPRKGRLILESCNVTCQDWLRAVECHHVTSDGRGLPKDRSELSQLACMIHYADVYMAKLSPRASRPAIAGNIAARDLFVNSDGAQNPYTAAIIKEMGIFPPGSFVKLANGDTAVVLRPGETASTPQVHSLISSDGWVFPDTKARDTSKTEFKVISAVPRANVLLRIDRQKLFGYAAA